MPTISLQRDDLEALIAGPGGKAGRIPLDQLEDWLMLVKGELKGHNPETGELRIELQDSNRPDLWCCEGIARQIRIKQRGTAVPYSFFNLQKPAAGKLLVAPGMEDVRPFVAACAAVGYRVTVQGLTQLIQTQEKLADIFGRKRRTVSIGLYRSGSTEWRWWRWVFTTFEICSRPTWSSFGPCGEVFRTIALCPLSPFSEMISKP